MDYTAARTNMVESQVRTNKVTDTAVIDALLAVPRERFVPAGLRGIAYVDEDLAVAPGRWLVEPMVFARLLQLGRVSRAGRVLHVACSTGYGLAVMARLAKEVVGLDHDAAQAEAARRLLAELGVSNARLVTGPLAAGTPGEKPFEVILIEGAVAEVPAGLCEQLAEGGRLLTVIKRTVGMGQAVLVERIRGSFSRRVLFDAATPLLPEFQAAESFVF